MSTRVVNAMQNHLRERSVGTIETYPSDIDMVKLLRADIATMVNAGSPERISLQVNTSDALNIVAAGLQWRTGDRLIVSNIEFPANIYPYLNLRSLGVEVDFLASDDGRVTPEMIEQSLTPRTRLVALSAVQFLSGHRADLKAIGELCRRRGMVFVVDGIQAVGAIRVDVRENRIDALAAGAQKWQMSPQGTGFLYLTEALQSEIRQKHLGWLSVHDPWQFYNYDQPLATSARRYEGGTLNFEGLCGMRAAISTILEFGLAAIEDQVLALSGILQEQLGSIAGLRMITPRRREERAGIVTVELPEGIDTTQLMARLQQRGLLIALRDGKLRFSPHFYNSVEDVTRATAILQESLV